VKNGRRRFTTKAPRHKDAPRKEKISFGLAKANFLYFPLGDSLCPLCLGGKKGKALHDPGIF
jgi:hypothetical protein